MFTDIVGYTALTQANESRALEALATHQTLLRSIFPKYRGKEIKTVGDSFLVEFESALEGTKCACEIQMLLHERNASSNDDWKMRLRIGLHLGDVVHEAEDVLGDAVNITSRIEPLAEPEGICISGQVFDQIRNKIAEPIEFLSPMDLKNVQFPIDVYKIVMPWEPSIPPGEPMQEPAQPAFSESQRTQSQKTPMVGRDNEVDHLKRRLIECAGGSGSLVFVAGEAGIGKSRLAEAFCNLATKEGFEILVGRCVPGALTPYLPYQDAFKSLSRHRYQSSNQLGSLKGRWPTGGEQDSVFNIDPASERDRAFIGTLEFLDKTSARKPVLLVLEDLQWADSASVQLTHFLARNLKALRLVVFATYRPEDIGTDRAGRIHPLVETLRVVRKEGVCDELTLARLDRLQLRVVIEGLLDGRVADELFEEVASESGGNPLFAIETIRWLLETDKIREESGFWTRTSSTQIDVPSTVKEVILRRIERLPDRERRILECASVVGEQFLPEVVGQALQLQRLGLLETLDHVEHNSLLVYAAGPAYRFSHEKIRRTLYDQISPLRRKELHKIIAEVFENQHDENLYGQLSVHFYNAGEAGKCIKYSVQAGQSSLITGAPREALDHFQRVIDVAGSNSSYFTERLQAIEGAGDSYRAVGLYNKAIGFYDQFLKLSTQPGYRVRVLRKSAEINYPSKVTSILDEAEKISGVTAVEIGRLRRTRGHLALSSGMLDEAEHLFSESEQIFGREEAKEDLAHVSMDLAAVYLAKGRPNEAQQKIERAKDLLSSSPSPGRQLAVWKQEGDVFWNMGLYDAAIENYTRAISLAEKLGRYPSLLSPLVYRGATYMAMDDFESAEKDAVRACEVAAKTESLYDRAWSTLFLAQVLAYRGKQAEAEKTFQQGLSVLESMALPRTLGIVAGADPFYSDPAARFYSIPFMTAYVSHLRAELLALKGETAASNEEFQKTMKLWKGSVHEVLFEGWSRSYYARALIRQGRYPEAKEQLVRSAELFRKLGNEYMLRKVEDGLASLGKAESEVAPVHH